MVKGQGHGRHAMSTHQPQPCRFHHVYDNHTSLWPTSAKHCSNTHREASCGLVHIVSPRCKGLVDEEAQQRLHSAPVALRRAACAWYSWRCVMSCCSFTSASSTLVFTSSCSRRQRQAAAEGSTFNTRGLQLQEGYNLAVAHHKPLPHPCIHCSQQLQLQWQSMSSPSRCTAVAALCSNQDDTLYMLCTQQRQYAKQCVLLG